MRIGTLDIDKPLLLAPMEDVTDLPFRIICKRLGADIVYTEFVNSEGLVRDSLKTKQKMQFWPEERPFGIQIYGGEEASMEGAAKIAERFQPDIIDINCGCWVNDVALRGAGAGLLRDLPKMERVVASVVNAVRLPVTVKTRLGWDQQSIRIVEVAQMLEQVGVQALTIHCRTRAQGHKGEPDFSWIPKVKAVVRIPLVVNGSIDTPEAVKQVFEDTGCDGVMIGRGAINNPWIFRHAKHYLRTGERLPEPSLEERRELILEHLTLAVEFKGERKGIIEFRKHWAGYLKGLPHASKVRQELMFWTELKPIVDRLSLYFDSLRRTEVADMSLL
jgi:tRNA-dihydrouridine synthase B